MIRNLAHACFNVADLERSLTFYRDGLGLKLAFEFRDVQGRLGGFYLKVGPRSFLEFFLAELDPKTEKQSYKHICLEVDNMAETVATLRKNGIETTDPKLGKDQSWQAWITDPDGNRIELHAYTPASWQTPHLS